LGGWGGKVAGRRGGKNKGGGEINGTLGGKNKVKISLGPRGVQRNWSES